MTWINKKRTAGQQKGPFLSYHSQPRYNRMLVHILGQVKVRLSITGGGNYLSIQGGRSSFSFNLQCEYL